MGTPALRLGLALMALDALSDGPGLGRNYRKWCVMIQNIMLMRLWWLKCVFIARQVRDCSIILDYRQSEAFRHLVLRESLVDCWHWWPWMPWPRPCIICGLSLGSMTLALALTLNLTVLTLLTSLVIGQRMRKQHVLIFHRRILT